MRIGLLLLLTSGLSWGQTWEQISDFPGTKRDDGVCFAIANMVYCGTGIDDGFNMTGDFYAFDLDVESWSPIASLPDSARRDYATSFTHDGEGYVFGGINQSGDYLNDLWRYTPSTDTWTLLFGLPGEGRSGSVCYVIQDTAYIVGGKSSSSNALSEVWAYTIPSNGWSQKADLPVNCWRGVGYSHQSQGYVGLGKIDLMNFNNEFYRYLPSTDAWELVPQLNLAPRAYAALSTIDDKVFIYGGETAGGYLNTLERINMSSLTVDVLTDFPSEARRGGSAFTNDTDFFLVNGVTTTERKKETWVARSALGLAPGEIVEDITIWQNDQSLHIQSLYLSNDCVFKLFSSRGEQCTIDALEGAQVNIAHLPAGIYFYALNFGDRIARGKVSIQH